MTPLASGMSGFLNHPKRLHIPAKGSNWLAGQMHNLLKYLQLSAKQLRKCTMYMTTDTVYNSKVDEVSQLSLRRDQEHVSVRIVLIHRCPAAL